MRTLARMLALPVTLLVLPAAAQPVDDGAVGIAEPYYAELPAADATPPPSAPPVESPPAPPSQTPPPPAQAQAAPVPPGQWVYTQQYGWVWMPYADAYTHVPPSGYGEPYAYVYYPVYGWTWVVAPWVWGWGPWPYFGAFGPWHFAWFGHGWWRHPGRWHWAPSPSFRGVVRPAPSPRVLRPAPRSGSTFSAGSAAPVRGAAPAFRGGTVGGAAVGRPSGGQAVRSGGGHAGGGRGGGAGHGGGRR